MQQAVLMLVLATMVYTVSLDLRVADFRYVATHPIVKSLGGVQVDAEARVRDAAGKSIPGLWAVGEVTGFGGLNGRAALEGTFIGLSILMGRVAGRALAKQHGGRPIPVRPLMLPSSTSISPSSGAAASSNGTCRASDATP